VARTKTLARFPRSGRKVPEFNDENTRELIAYSSGLSTPLNQIKSSSLP
jgi:hypothetical protein